MPIDLHTHSSRSDGTATPTELVAEAAAHGLDVVALTDHDTVDGWQEAATAAVANGVTLVRGIELSTRYDGRSVHLLAYLPDPSYQPLAAEMARVRGGRDSRLPLMMERLRELDIDITEDDVRDGAAEGAVLGRPHVADALVGKGVVGHRNEAFEKMLGPGGPAFVPRYATSLPHAVELVRAAGGVPVVAHPWGRNRVLTAAALADLQQRGLVGIEVDHQDHAPAAREELRRIAGDLGLVATGSSDWHGTGKVD
ncbi:MAG TPA: PHP domain-containing protein, partial [Marmoricola sp.]